MRYKKLFFDKKSEYHPDIVTAKSVMPEWYKNAKTFLDKKPRFIPTNNVTIKGCMPFLDTYICGYMYLLKGDVIVEKDDIGNSILTWGSEELVTVRSKESHQKLPFPVAHEEQYFSWAVSNSIELPNNYSFLVTHPLNRFDLPFTTLSAIIDKSLSVGALSFFIHKDFTGLIPAGTPIAQIIPFKQTSWKALRKEGLSDKLEDESKGFRMLLAGGYKKKKWVRKRYE